MSSAYSVSLVSGSSDMTVLCTENQARALIANITPGQLIGVRRTEEDSAPAAPARQPAPADPSPSYQPAGTRRPSSIPALMEMMRDFELQEREERKRRFVRNLALFTPFILIPVVAVVFMVYPLAQSGALRIGLLQ